MSDAATGSDVKEIKQFLAISHQKWMYSPIITPDVEWNTQYIDIFDISFKNVFFKLLSKIIKQKMNRNQYRLGRTIKKNDNIAKVTALKGKCTNIQEVYTLPKINKELAKFDKFLTDRCCLASPNVKDFGQFIRDKQPAEQNLLYVQHSTEPIVPETAAQLEELKNVLCKYEDKVENSSQYVTPEQLMLKSTYVETCDGAHWQNVEDVGDIEKIIMNDKHTQKGNVPFNHSPSLKNVHVSEVPRVKIIAKKFTRCKRNNIEIRKLEEKIVCLEYDIFEESDPDKPLEVMRAFFSIKPVANVKEAGKDSIPPVPSDIKRNFKIKDNDLKSLNEKEVEIIDSKIGENKPYLDDLKKVLTRKKNTHVKDNKNCLNLMSLYEIAKRENANLSNYGNNLLTDEELKEVKDMILAKCTSSCNGVCRRTVKSQEDSGNASENIGVISQSIFAELLREEAKTNVLK